jgi:hypothetical protein
VVSKSISSGYISTTNTEINNTQSTNTSAEAFGTENTNKVLQTDSISNTNNTSVRGLLRSILDVIVNTDAVGGNSMNIISPGGTPPPAIVQNYSPSVDVSGTILGTGRATYYDPKLGGINGTGKLSTGGVYSYTEMNGAVFPDLILRLPEEYTTGTKEYPEYFKGKTIKKPFMVKVIQRKTGKQAYIKINDVGIGVLGDRTRLIDMNTATKKYFGGDSGDMEIQLAPKDAKPGALPDLPKFENGGEYVFNEFAYKRWAGARKGRKHAGEDISMRSDGTFQSFVGGKVMYKGFQAGKKLYGHYIDIYNDKLKVTERIAEAGQFYVKPGDIVKPGQIVSTGTSTEMIHYEIRPTTADPVKYLQSIGAVSITSNTIKNNSLQSLLDGTTLTADLGGSSGGATPDNMSTAVAPQPIPVDYSKIGKAFTDLTIMLGVGGEKAVVATPKQVKATTIVDKNMSNNININVIKSGNSANVITVEQKIISANTKPDMRLRRL